MTDTEISRRLALAIGYETWQIDTVLWGDVRVWHDKSWLKFDHRDERTIFRIAERFKLFPQWDADKQCWLVKNRTLSTWSADASTCIALAVIEASERGLLL